jgi:amino-acid N-acetyltransferase
MFFTVEYIFILLIYNVCICLIIVGPFSVPRSREQLEAEMANTYLLTRDSATLACGMLKIYGDKHAEIACLAVNPSYRRSGRGETLLNYLERRALVLGIEHVFVLSTRTMQWFEERGFSECDPSLLPPDRKYNKARGSKVYMKQLVSQRALDAEELLWNVSGA